MRRIEDYALIGDGETAALIARDGSIDWLCWPRFDSAACFAALLGKPAHGRWLLAPAGKCETSRRYRPDTLILETTFRTESGEVTLTDFMPPRDGGSNVVRVIRGSITQARSHGAIVSSDRSPIDCRGTYKYPSVGFANVSSSISTTRFGTEFSVRKGRWASR